MIPYTEYYKAAWDVQVYRASDIRGWKEKREKYKRDLINLPALLNELVNDLARRGYPPGILIQILEGVAQNQNVDALVEKYIRSEDQPTLWNYANRYREAVLKSRTIAKDTLQLSQHWSINNILQDLRISHKANELSEGALGFYDPNLKIAAAIKKFDFIYITCGWEGASTERYKNQLQFVGVVTNIQTQMSGGGPSKTQITCNDERVLLKGDKKNDVHEAMKDSQFIYEMLKQAIAVNVTDSALERSKHIIYNESILKSVTDKAKANGFIVRSQPSRGSDQDEVLYYYIPWENFQGENFDVIFSPTRPNEVGMVLDFQYSEAYKEAEDEGQDSGEGDPEEPSDIVLPESTTDTTLIGDTTGSGDQPGDGNDNNVTESTLQTEISDENRKALENMYDRNATVTLRGEPHMYIGDVLNLKGFNSAHDGIYKIIGIEHTLGTQPFTTQLNLYREGELVPLDLQSVIDEHTKAFPAVLPVIDMVQNTNGTGRQRDLEIYMGGRSTPI